VYELADVVLLNQGDAASAAETTRIQKELRKWMKPNAAIRGVLRLDHRGWQAGSR